MTTTVHTLANWGFFYLVFGAVLALLDRRFGVLIYRSMFKWTHKSGLAEGELRGFITHQTVRGRMAFATFVVMTKATMNFLFASPNLLLEIVLIGEGIFVLMLGFYLTRPIIALFERIVPVFTKLDKVESGEISIKDSAREFVRDVGERIHEIGEGLTELDHHRPNHPKGTISDPEPTEHVVPTNPPAPTVSPEDEGRKKIREFTDRYN